MLLDIIILILIALNVVIGYKKGFVSVALKLVGFILAVILAITFKDSLAEFASNELGMKNTISVSVKNSIDGYISAENKDSQRDEKKGDSEAPGGVLKNNRIFNTVSDEIEGATTEQKNNLVKKWSDKITDFVLKGAAFIVIFLVVRIIIWIAGIILNTVMDLPVLKTFNGLAGAGTQLVLVILEIYIILSIISFLSPLEILGKVEQYINNSFITKWMYNNNMLVDIITNMLLRK